MEPMEDQGVSTQLLVPSGSVCFSYVNPPWRLFLRKEVGEAGAGAAGCGRDPSISRHTNTGGCLPTTCRLGPGFPSGGREAGGGPGGRWGQGPIPIGSPLLLTCRCSTPGRTSATPTASGSSVSR